MAAQFSPIRVLGMMSGTSLDGVDAAILETDGESALGFGASGFEAYSEGERDILRHALGSWPGDDVDAAHQVVLDAHSRMSKTFEMDLIGFHGQTLAHDPDNGKTHQLGDGEALARNTGHDVVWDFRTSDMEAGGQGAPLAPFFHHALARHAGFSEPVAFLNLGGVGNVTWVDPAVEKPDQKGALLAFDTGPANALLDDYLAEKTSQPYDKDGALAAEGRVSPDILKEVDSIAYFRKPAPKSLDRDDFSYLLDGLGELEASDGAACLTAVTAQAVKAGLSHLPGHPTKWLVCGGGRHNATMMAMIAEAVDAPVEPVENYGFDGDMLEAQAFAWLAVRVLRGLPTSAPSTTGCKRPVSGGRVSTFA